MDRLRLEPGGLAHSLGDAPGRRAQQDIDALGRQDAQDRVDDGQSRSQAETAIDGYIDGFYNPICRYSTLDFTSPVKFKAEAMQTV